jgi:hypothetical protein
MSYASRFGRARIDPRNPRAQAICDRCGFGFNHQDLSWQMEYAGKGMINKRLLVCHTCMDVPQDQLRSINLPADPVPISNPRVPDFAAAETSNRVTSNGDNRVTMTGQDRVIQQTGAADGTLNNKPGTDPNAPGNANPGLPYNTDEVPKIE